MFDPKWLADSFIGLCYFAECNWNFGPFGLCHNVWTFDFCTLYLFVTFKLQNFQVFLQEQLPSDLMRVDLLFQNALEAGINIQVQPIH